MSRSGADTLLVVKTSSERTPASVRQDSSFAEKQERRPGLLLVVQGSHAVATRAGFSLSDDCERLVADAARRARRAVAVRGRGVVFLAGHVLAQGVLLRSSSTSSIAI